MCTHKKAFEAFKLSSTHLKHKTRQVRERRYGVNGVFDDAPFHCTHHQNDDARNEHFLEGCDGDTFTVEQAEWVQNLGGVHIANGT